MSDLKWLLFHVGALLVGVGAAYFLVQGLFANGVFHESPRMQWDGNPLTKLVWFLANPLPNALALYALRDDYYHGFAVFIGAALVMLLVIVLGFRLGPKTDGPLLRKKWFWCLVLLPVVGHGVSLVAAERSTGYRTLFALSGLVLVATISGLRVLAMARRVKPIFHYVALGLLAIGAAVLASRQAFTLIAEPQGHEWDLVRSAVLRANFSKAVKVYFVTPTLAERSTDRVFKDEFGSLSSDSEWAAKEMFKAAVHDRYPDKLPKGGSYTFKAGREAPPPGAYDLVIDLRKLKQFREP